MTVVFIGTFAMLGIGALLTLVRLVRGPRTLDRILAVDVLVVLILAGVAVEMAISGRGLNISLLVAVALLGFVGTISAVRLAERRRDYR